MLKNHHLQILALVLAFALPGTAAPLVAGPAPATVRQEPTVHLSKAQLGSFSVALETLAAQGHVAIVAEGAPLVPIPAEKDVPDLMAPVPLSAAVAKIAAAYDYDVQVSDGVFVLTKRYIDPKELPCVTLEECRLAFADVVILLNRCSPQLDEGSDDNCQRSNVLAFFSSLSPAQFHAAQAKTLHYGELTPDQKKIISRLLLYGLFQMPISLSQDSLDVLDYAPKSVLTGKDGDYTGLLIQIPVPANKALLCYRPLYSSGKAISLNQPQPILILPEPKAGNTPPAPEPKTLGDVVGLLAHTGPPPAVEAALKDKPVSVAGLNNTSPRNVLAALKTLYDLRIGVSDAGGSLLQRKFLTTDDSLQDLTESVWETLPVPMVRALHLENSSPVQETPGSPAWVSNELQMQMGGVLAKLRTEAEHQVLLGVQPQFRSKGLSTTIPVKTLDKVTQRALAVALAGSALETLVANFSGPTHQKVMGCLDDMDDILISTVPSEAGVVHGQLVPSLHLEGTNPYIKEQVGLGGVQFLGSR